MTTCGSYVVYTFLSDFESHKSSYKFETPTATCINIEVMISVRANRCLGHPPTYPTLADDLSYFCRWLSLRKRICKELNNIAITQEQQVRLFLSPYKWLFWSYMGVFILSGEQTFLLWAYLSLKCGMYLPQSSLCRGFSLITLIRNHLTSIQSVSSLRLHILVFHTASSLGSGHIVMLK